MQLNNNIQYEFESRGILIRTHNAVKLRSADQRPNQPSRQIYFKQTLLFKRFTG